MTRRMSCSMTIDAVKDRIKTVTRRHVDTWTTLRARARTYTAIVRLSWIRDEEAASS